MTKEEHRKEFIFNKEFAHQIREKMTNPFITPRQREEWNKMITNYLQELEQKAENHLQELRQI